jgi:hypothetical protein
MKERILYALAALILATCFSVGVHLIFDVLHTMDCAPNKEMWQPSQRQQAPIPEQCNPLARVAHHRPWYA